MAFHGAWEERDHLYMQTELCATSMADLADAEHSIPESTVWAYMVDLLLVGIGSRGPWGRRLRLGGVGGMGGSLRPGINWPIFELC